jgi:flagellar biogenesis protein FliO
MRLKNILAIFCLFFLTTIQAHLKTPDVHLILTAAPSLPVPETPPPEPHPEAPAVPPLPSSQEMTGSYENAFIRMLVTLIGLIFLVFATFWILRRLGKGKFKMGGNGRIINIIERRALSPKTVLYIVEVGNKKILVSESQFEVRTLAGYEELPEEN